MFRKQSFWKGSALLLASAMIAKLLGACFKIPLTNVLGGTGMGYFSTAYGLLLPVYALSVTGLSAAVAQTVSRAAALEHWAEVRRIRDTARLACGVLGPVDRGVRPRYRRNPHGHRRRNHSRRIHRGDRDSRRPLGTHRRGLWVLPCTARRPHGPR